jgi:uncharacterized membrane protein YgdD (TMEM256/DUF423 family)
LCVLYYAFKEKSLRLRLFFYQEFNITQLYLLIEDLALNSQKFYAKVKPHLYKRILAMWIALSALNLALAVMLGAFGAHGLKALASPEQLIWWHTATEYFFYHGLALLALAILQQVRPTFPIKFSFISIQLGIVLFCGSLYIMGVGLPRGLGAITPIGGALMILGWLVLAYNAIKFKPSNTA